MAALVRAEHALARGRRIVVRDDRLLTDFLDRGAAPAGQWMRGMRKHHELVAAERKRLQPAIGRLEGQDAEIQTAIEELGRNGSRTDAPNLDERLGVRLREALEKRQERVNRRLVRADDHAAAAHLLQLAHGDLGVCRKAQEPARVLLQQHPGFGQRAVAN